MIELDDRRQWNSLSTAQKHIGFEMNCGGIPWYQDTLTSREISQTHIKLLTFSSIPCQETQGVHHTRAKSLSIQSISELT